MQIAAAGNGAVLCKYFDKKEYSISALHSV
jgi:hypothetical protein